MTEKTDEKIPAPIYQLEKVILQTFWMARRYANGRKTGVPYTVNECREVLLRLGMTIAPDHTLVDDGNSNPDVLDTP